MSTIICTLCDGRGEVYHCWQEPCGVIPSDCDGAGDTYYAQREAWVSCERCNGTGREACNLPYPIPQLLDAQKRGEIILNLDGEPCCPQCGYLVNKCRCGR